MTYPIVKRSTPTSQHHREGLIILARMIAHSLAARGFGKGDAESSSKTENGSHPDKQGSQTTRKEGLGESECL
jgi:hypothetical protein